VRRLLEHPETLQPVTIGTPAPVRVSRPRAATAPSTLSDMLLLDPHTPHLPESSSTPSLTSASQPSASANMSTSSSSVTGGGGVGVGVGGGGGTGVGGARNSLRVSTASSASAVSSSVVGVESGATPHHAVPRFDFTMYVCVL